MGKLVEKAVYGGKEFSALESPLEMICHICQASLPSDALYCSRCGSSTHSGGGDDIKSTETYLKGQEPLSPDTLLGERYRIVRIAGRGGMGVVYKAEDTKLGRPVALKLLPPELKIDQDARRRFIHEARAAAGLESPYICTVHEIHDEGDNPFISMEFINGMSLREKLNGGPLSVRKAVDIAIQVASGLQAAARKGVIHRDIKSANIMITRDGHAKIMDFGLAKAAESTMHTKSGAVMGTAAYMSPEQGRGEYVDARTDIWSLGVVLYEMLSGQLPFKGESQASLIYAAMHTEPRSLKELSPAISDEVDATVRKAMSKESDDRYSSAGEMLLDLRRCFVFLGPEIDQQVETFGSIQRKSLKAAVFLAFIGLTIVIVWTTGRNPDGGKATVELGNDRALAAIEQVGETLAVPESNKRLNDAISRIRELMTQGNLVPGMSALREAESSFPGSHELAVLRADYQAALTAHDQTARRPVPKEKASFQVKTKASEDDETFARAVRTGTPGAYAVYLKEYPEGRNASKALELLEDLEAVAREEKQRFAAELDDAAFNAAQLQPTPEELNKYLMNFPAGRHEAEARGILASLAVKPGQGRGAPVVKSDAQQRKAGTIESIRVNDIEIQMAWIPAGTFQMGSTNVNSGRSQRPVHSVTISKGFWIGVHEITQSEWSAVMGSNPSRLPASGRKPVDSVSWEDCQAFLKQLNRLANKPFRLPTEAEWEYACRAESADNWYGDWNSISWHMGNSKGTAHEVGQKRPNSFDLYDMVGNVWEWCQDWYETDYYKNSPTVDPTGPFSGKEKVVRGGSWLSPPENAHSAVRSSAKPEKRKSDLGFRLVLEER